MSQTVRGYVPEKYSFAEKDSLALRELFEACALLDAENAFQPVAYRGRQIADLLDRVGGADMAFLQAHCKTHRFLLLDLPQGRLLICSDWLNSTGLLLAVLLQCEVQVILQSMRFAALGEAVVCAPSVEHKRVRKADLDLCERLKDHLISLTRILSANPDVCIRSHVRLISDFAGCRTHTQTNEELRLSLLPYDFQRLSAFLLCTFLTLRTKTGSVDVIGKRDDVPSDALKFRVRYTPLIPLVDPREHARTLAFAVGTETKHLTSVTDQFPELFSIRAFRNFSVSQYQNVLYFDGIFCMPTQAALQSVGFSCSVLFAIEIATENAIT